MRNLLFIAIFACVAAVAAQGLIPDSLSITNRRGEAEEHLAHSAYKGQPLLFTNCYALGAGGTQDLSNITVVVTVGTPGTRNSATGTVTSATNGAWTATVTIPDAIAGRMAFIQVKLIDSLTNSFIYPLKRIGLQEEL